MVHCSIAWRGGHTHAKVDREGVRPSVMSAGLTSAQTILLLSRECLLSNGVLFVNAYQ